MLRLAAASNKKLTLPPVYPTGAALWALPPLTTGVQPLHLYKGESWNTIREWSMAKITPATHPAE